MPLELRIVSSALEVPEIVEGWIENELLLLVPQLFSVDWGTDESSKTDRIQDLSARQWFMHSTIPGSVWLKVVDTDLDDKVVAASRWTIQTTEAPNRAMWPSTVYWLPPGPGRRFLEAIRARRASTAGNDPTLQKPHIRRSFVRSHVTQIDLVTAGLISNYTCAEHRRRGANTLMMEWGNKKADELGLNIWLEASALGSMVYTRHAFRPVRTIELYPPPELQEDNDEWRHWEEVTKELRLVVMMRPVNGKWDENSVEIGSFPTRDLVRNVWLKH